MTHSSCMSLLRIILVLSLWLLNSCAVGPNFKRPAPSLPETYAAKINSKTIATNTKLGTAQTFIATQDLPKQWWRVFNSSALNDLVIASLKCNPTVTAAQHALHAALETAYSARGALYPTLAVSFLPSRQKTADLLTSVLASNQYLYSLYTGQIYVSYTLDVFGGTRRQVESLMADAEAQHFQLEATYLTLTANVVSAAIQEAGLREQIAAIHAIITSQKKLLAIAQQQFKLGDNALIDVVTQQAALAASEASLPPLQKQLAIQRNLLNALIGRYPEDKRTPRFTLNSLHLPKNLPLSVPSELIEHRPDIRAAEAQMHSANALIGVAIANRLPKFTLDGTNAGTAATTIGTLLQPQTRFWALAGIIAHPIFNGGILRHKQHAAKEVYCQAAAQYRSTVINAFQNVTDTLKVIQSDAIALHAANKSERAALTSLNISRKQFALGDNSLVALLLLQQNYQQARLNLIQAQTNRLADTVALFQALGGGWQKTSLAKK
ncbi:MAG: efflux transporter outer membrane subunit [Legionella sp.]|uniref:efflux transporter outer membrane subunit n=1 Tax=Legionella sp. TaxID=459 RepID=UPI0039E5FA90